MDPGGHLSLYASAIKEVACFVEVVQQVAQTLEMLYVLAGEREGPGRYTPGFLAKQSTRRKAGGDMMHALDRREDLGHNR
jgi:hypothetical protein